MQTRLVLNLWQSPSLCFLSSGITCMCHTPNWSHIAIQFFFTPMVSHHTQLYLQTSYTHVQMAVEWLWFPATKQLGLSLSEALSVLTLSPWTDCQPNGYLAARISCILFLQRSSDFLLYFNHYSLRVIWKAANLGILLDIQSTVPWRATRMSLAASSPLVGLLLLVHGSFMHEINYKSWPSASCSIHLRSWKWSISVVFITGLLLRLWPLCQSDSQLGTISLGSYYQEAIFPLRMTSLLLWVHWISLLMGFSTFILPGRSEWNIQPGPSYQ